MRRNSPGIAGRLARALLLLTVLALLGAPARVAPPVAAAELTVTANSATTDFPSAITFHLAASAPQPVTRVDVHYRPLGSPVTEVGRADVTPGRQVDARYTLDTSTNYLPPGIDIAYRWQLTYADGGTEETPEQTLTYTDPRFHWQTTTADTVTVTYYAGDQRFGQDALDTTVDAIRQFEERFGVQVNDPVDVVIYGSEHDFAGALPANSSEWIGGFADPTLNVIVADIAPGSGAAAEIDRVLTHEVVHLILDEATHNPFNDPPAWLNEGLATYYQAVPDTRMGALLDDAVANGRLIPVRALNTGFPDDPDQALLSYAESESIVRFIIETRGEAAMADLLKVFRNGVAYDVAVQQALGLSLDDLDREWKAWLDYPGDSPAAAAPSAPQSDGTEIGNGVGSVPLLIAALIAVAAGAIAIRRAHRPPDDA